MRDKRKEKRPVDGCIFEKKEEIGQRGSRETHSHLADDLLLVMLHNVIKKGL